jgi:hypothetical protein
VSVEGTCHRLRRLPVGHGRLNRRNSAPVRTHDPGDIPADCDETGWAMGGKTLYARAMVTDVLTPLPAESVSLGPKVKCACPSPRAARRTHSSWSGGEAKRE